MFFFPVLLKYWHITLYKFKVHNRMTWYMWFFFFSSSCFCLDDFHWPITDFFIWPCWVCYCVLLFLALPFDSYRNGRDLTEAEDIKKRWQEYTEEIYKKDLHDPDNNDGVITHLEPDIPECEVKWALGSNTTNKASGGDGIPVELFQVLKDDAVKVLH